MTRFHTDEYIDLLEAVTPETADALTGAEQGVSLSCSTFPYVSDH